MEKLPTNKLAAYLAGVSAAGVAAGSGNSEAAVLYTDFDPDLSATDLTNAVGDNQRIRLSIDIVSGLTATVAGSGTGHITLHPADVGPNGGKFNLPTIAPPHIDAGVGTIIGTAVVGPGSLIDGTTGFGSQSLNLPYFQAQEGFVGFRHDSVGGESYYGWFHYEVRPGASPFTAGEMILLEGAIESSPGVGITIPEPGLIPLLALGAAGFAARRRRSVVA